MNLPEAQVAGGSSYETQHLTGLIPQHPKFTTRQKLRIMVALIAAFLVWTLPYAFGESAIYPTLICSLIFGLIALWLYSTGKLLSRKI